MRSARMQSRCAALPWIAALAISLFAHSAAAQEYPSRPITLIYPIGSGSAPEIAARALAAETSKILGQTLVFENRPGANARNGVNAMKNARPDGYTIAWGFDSVLAIQQTLAEQGLLDDSYRLQEGRDYQPVTLSIEFFVIMAGNPKMPFRDLNGLIAYAKANPGKINFAYGATGSYGHLVTELFNDTAGVQTTLIPYKGNGPALIDLVTGQVDLLFVGSAARPFMDQGKLFGIATAGKNRFRPYMDFPTLEQAGLPMAAGGWFGVIAPGATPPAVIAKLNAAFNAAANSPGIAKHFEENGFTTGIKTTPAEFSAHIKAETKRWAPIMKKIGAAWMQ